MHPLDPLSADEITQAVAIVRRDRDLPLTFRFASVTLEEPAKARLAALDGTTVERLARGITDAKLVLFDVWAYGDALVPEQGFFDKNPALDVPPEKERCHGQHAR